MAEVLRHDERVVLVLDAGGTSLRFNAIQGGRALLEAPRTLPSFGDDLERCLRQIIGGFADAHAATGRRAVALSLAFPGPADYRRGIIGDLPNLPGFRGGVPLGPMLAARFGLPAFINNDGALFTYGEALGGLLPVVNDRLAAGGSDRRYRTLLGFTLGTGFGCGVVIDGRLFIGDNSAAGQIWTLRHRDDRQRVVDDGASIRGVRREYAAQAGVPLEQVPEPRLLARIAAGELDGELKGELKGELDGELKGELKGDRRAAVAAFRRLGQVAGDAIASALAVIDGLVVLGGGLSGAAELFRGALLDEVNGTLESWSGPVRRLPFEVLDLDDPAGLDALVADEVRALAVPGTGERVAYAPHKRTGIGTTRLGTTAAIALGAYAFALGELGR
ncbi:MAG TPA: ROK family protein [Kofleriaceae bacterium]|nr:ROK family protein [Kofleriaceae bacterium]